MDQPKAIRKAKEFRRSEMVGKVRNANQKSSRSNGSFGLGPKV